jgi:chromosomal replication initiation ATPase DnaA
VKRKVRKELDHIRIEMAVAMTAGALDTSFEDVMGDGRGTAVVLARQVAMYVAVVGFGMSYGRVASVMGRDRSTVAHAIRQVEIRREDPAFDRWLDALEMTAATTPVLS